MAKVELPREIAAIHGRIGDYVYKTRNGQTYVYYMPRKKRLSKHNGSTLEGH